MSAQRTSCQNVFSSPLYVHEFFLARWSCAKIFFLCICTCRIFFFTITHPPPPPSEVEWSAPKVNSFQEGLFQDEIHYLREVFVLDRVQLQSVNSGRSRLHRTGGGGGGGMRLETDWETLLFGKLGRGGRGTPKKILDRPRNEVA